MTDPAVRDLARRLAALEAQVGKRGTQLEHSALEDGAIREFNLDGQQVAQYGTQWDGTHTAASLSGPPPPTPSAPVAQDASGGLLVGWDGTYADGFSVSPMDWARIDVAVGPPGFDPIATPPVAAITSPRGGLAFVGAAPGDYEVALVARSQSGAASLPSVRATATSQPEADGAAVAAAQDTADQAIADALAAHLLGQQGVTDAAAAQADADAALTAAANAVTAAGGKITAFRQASAPSTSGRTTGDLWIDTDDGLLYVWTGAWTASPDQRIATVVASNATKTTVFAQASAPSTSGRTIGDVWIDTDDGNRQYVWEGSWVDRRDATIAAAALLAQQAKTSADAKITVYRQSSAPTGTFAVNDLWLDIDDGLVYYATTTGGGWTLHSDQRIGLVVTSNAAKITAFYQASAPTTTGRVTGDLWIDSDDFDRMYRWSGSAWVVTDIATAGYIASRGTNLITNGTGLLGTNQNFTQFTFDASDAPVGAGGAFLTPLGSHALRTNDEFLPVDPTKKFRLSCAVRNKGTTTTGGYVYTGLMPFDAAKVQIDPSHYMWIANTDTTLAVDLNPGATTVTLTSAANWYGSAAKPAGNNYYWRRIIFWDYIDQFGKAWPEHTYSRNQLTGTASLTPTGGAWSDGGITGNVITLNAPYAGPAKPAGTKVSNGTSGGSYMYVGAVNSIVRATDGWVTFAQTITDNIVDGSVGSATAAAGWPQGIAFVKFVALPNRTSAGVADALSQHSFALLSLSDAAAAQADATAAGVLAAGKATVYRQSSAPATAQTNDMWVDSDDGLLYVWTGSWTLSADQRIASVVSSNATKITAFAQTSAPSTTGRVIGDIWVDTDDSNKIHVWDGAWTVRLMGATAISATARQLGAVYIYRQSTAPASGMANNDLWIDSDDGLVYVYTGTWTLSADQRIAAVVTSNATKVSAFWQTSAPSTSGRALGDLWFDTDDKNKPYIWTGAWTSARDASIADADAKAVQALADAAAAASAASAAAGTASTALTAANGKNKITHADYAPTNEANTLGDTWFVHAPVGDPNAGALTGQFQGLGGTAWSAATISHQLIGSIDLGVATVGKLTANYIESGTLAAALQITGMLIAGNVSGARVVIDDGGIRQYGATGDILINLPTNGDPAQFEGSIIAQSATVESLILLGLANEISRGAILKVMGGTTSPTAAPTVAVGYPTYDPARWNYLYVPNGIHGEVDDSPEITGSMSFFGYGRLLGKANKYYDFPEVTESNGSKRSTYGNFSSAVTVHVGGAERVVTFGYKTVNGGVPAGSMDSWDPAPMTSTGTVAPVNKATRAQAGSDSFLYDVVLGRVHGPVATPYHDRCSMAIHRLATNDVVLRQYTVADTGFTQVGSDLVVAEPFAAGEAIIGVTHGMSDRMGFPGTAQYVWLVHGSVKTYAYNTSLTRLPDLDFNSPPGARRMMSWFNTTSNTFVGFRSLTHSDKSVITKLTGNHWASASYPYKIWASQTWFDADAGGTGQHETAQGPRASLILPRRAGIVVTGLPYPARPFPTTQDDPLSMKIYIGRSTIGAPTADPGRTYMELAGTLNSPTRTLQIGTFAFPAATAVTPPPVASNFPASSPGVISSADGTGWVLQGDGKATLAGVEFDATKPGFVSASMRAQVFASTDGTNITSVSTTGATMGARGGQGTFIAPPSGNVLIFTGGQLRSGVDGQYAAIGYEVRAGAVIGSGTVVQAYSIDMALINFSVQSIRALGGPFLLSGLTPGATYNARQMIASGTTTASTFAWGRLTILPAS
jgi:hypothetical protein